MKHCELTTDLQACSKEQLISLVGALITAAEDEAYAYDLQDGMAERLSEVLTDHEISHKLVDEEL